MLRHLIDRNAPWYGLDVNARAVMVHLLLSADEQGGVKLSLVAMAEGCGLSVKATRIALGKLESLGVIAKTGAQKGAQKGAQAGPSVTIVGVGVPEVASANGAQNRAQNRAGSSPAIGDGQPPNPTRRRGTPDPDIDFVIAHLKSKVGPVLDGSQKKQRQYAHLLLTKLAAEHNGDKQKMFVAFIKVAMRDDFHLRNLASLSYLYDKAGRIIQAGRLAKAAQKAAAPAPQPEPTGWLTPQS